MSRVTELTDDNEKVSEEPSRPDTGAEESGSRFKMPSLSYGARIGEFYHGVKLEMSKTTWPTRTEVWSTTVVVLLAIVFFGFYLWGVDRLVTLGFQALERSIR